MANTVKKSNGDVLLANTMPQAEYMYGCMPTAVGMLLGYYDLYGYNGAKMTNLINGTVAVKSRGTDGNAYDMDAFDTVLGKAIASKGYVNRFYGQTPDDELRYTFKGDTTELNTAEWDCIADYLGTGQYWRGNADKATTVTTGSLEHTNKVTQVGTISYGSNTRTIPWSYVSMHYGLDLYVQSRGYSLDRTNSGSFNVDTNGGSFTFEDFKKEIDAGRPVIVSITGHAMVAYGYNPDTHEIIFDDCYSADQRMTWGGTYYYDGIARSLESIETIVFNVSSGGGGGGGGSSTKDTVKPTVSNIKVSTTAPTNKAVTVRATFSDDVKLASSLYRIGSSGSWKAYPTDGVSVTKNSTVYFQAVDAAGNKSAIASYKVTNIDTTAPSKPTISVSTKKSTTNPVTVTAKFSSDSSKKQYSTDGTTWKTYSVALTFKTNGTAYFRGTDEAGNVSAIASYTVSNIKGSAPAYDTSGCDDGIKNEYVLTKDKSGKTLRNSDSNLASTTLSKSSTDVEIRGDTKSVSKDGKHNFVGDFDGDDFDDLTDFAKIKLNSAAKLSLTATATAAAKFTVYALTTKTANSKTTYKLKKLKTVSLKAGNDFKGEINDLLLDKVTGTDYYISVKYAGAKNSGAYYNVYMKSDSVFFNKGNTSDDLSDPGSMKSLSLVSPGATLLNDWVGFGDTIDFRKFTLTSAANLGFSLTAGNAAKLTLYKVVTNGSKTSLKALKSVSVKQQKSDRVSLGLIEKGITYALSVKSTAPAKSDNAAGYSVSLSPDSVFYNHSDSSTHDDEVIIKVDGQNYVNNSIGNAGYLDKATPYNVFASGWVGFGDTIDYKRFSVMSKKDLTFAISASDKVQFTIYELVSKTSGGKPKHSLKKKKSWTPRNNGEGSYVDFKMKITLEAGTNYYFSVKSTNASKGGNAEYFVFVPGEDLIVKDALTMPEASANLEALTASSAAADSDLLAGLTDFGAGDALASANLSATAQLQLEDSGTLQPLSGLLA